MPTTEDALLIIDLLEDFVSPEGALSVGERGVAACRAAGEHLAAWRRLGGLVIHATDAHTADDPEFAVWPRHCVVGTIGARPRPEVAPAAGEAVVPKRHFSAFFDTGLDQLLRARGVRRLTLCGVCTNICVLYTAADAQMRGYRLRVLADACAGTTEEAHRFALGELRATLGAEILA